MGCLGVPMRNWAGDIAKQGAKTSRMECVEVRLVLKISLGQKDLLGPCQVSSARRKRVMLSCHWAPSCGGLW